MQISDFMSQTTLTVYHLIFSFVFWKSFFKLYQSDADSPSQSKLRLRTEELTINTLSHLKQRTTSKACVILINFTVQVQQFCFGVRVAELSTRSSFINSLVFLCPAQLVDDREPEGGKWSINCANTCIWSAVWAQCRRERGVALCRRFPFSVVPWGTPSTASVESLAESSSFLPIANKGSNSKLYLQG